MPMLLSRLGDRIFELLVVSRPADLASRAISIGLTVVIVANAAAQALETWLPLAEWSVALTWLARVSLGLFALEYLVRVGFGHTDGGRNQSPLRRIIHPLMLIDLAILVASTALWWSVDLRFLRLVRVPDLLARIARTMAARELADTETAFSDVLRDRRQALAAIRRELSVAAREDLDDMRELLQTTTAEIRRVQQRWILQARRDADAARKAIPEIRETIDGLLNTLEEQLHLETRLQDASVVIRSTYESSAASWDEAQEIAIDARDLQWRSYRSYRPVPVRSIGQRHFRPLAARWNAAHATFRSSYETGLQDGLSGVRAALGFPFDRMERGDREGGTSQLQAGFSRGLSRCRDLDALARSVWEQTQWQLELAHVNGTNLVVGDVGRYGRIDFYATLGARRLGSFLLRLYEAGRLYAYHGITYAIQALKQANRSLRQTFQPALEWLGIVQPPRSRTMEQAEQARLESVLQSGLPDDYMAHFDMKPLTDELLLVGFDQELGEIDQAIGRWESGQTSSFIVRGPRGGGKTSLLNVAADRLFEEDARVVRDTIQEKIIVPERLTSYLTNLLDLDRDIADINGIARALLKAPPQAVLLEGCHNLFLRRIGGLQAIRQLLWLVARTNHHVLWGICLEENAHAFLSSWLPIDRLFHYDIGIGEHSADDLRNLLMQRHNLSGYRLRFTESPDIQRALRRRVRSYQHIEEPVVQAALQEIYFERLAETCFDNTTVAQFYWLRSLSPGTGDMLTVAPHEEIDLDQVRDLSTEVAFLLVAILQHDNLSPAELAEVVDSSLIDVRLELEILWSNNILGGSLERERFRINTVALKPVRAMLASRNLIT